MRIVIRMEEERSRKKKRRQVKKKGEGDVKGEDAIKDVPERGRAITR